LGDDEVMSVVTGLGYHELQLIMCLLAFALKGPYAADLRSG